MIKSLFNFFNSVYIKMIAIIKITIIMIIIILQPLRFTLGREPVASVVSPGWICSRFSCRKALNVHMKMIYFEVWISLHAIL